MQRHQENYFSHVADMGVIGRGNTIEESFMDAAEAMFAIMADLSQIKLKQSVDIYFVEKDLELAFVTWLNQCLTLARENKLIFSQFELTKSNDEWHGKAYGDVWNDLITPGVEVKGATLTALSVKKINSTWEARVVVDI